MSKNTTSINRYPYYLLPSVVQGAVGLALVPLTTFYLEPVDFGVYALLIAVALPVRAFAATGARWVIGGNYFNATESERRTMLFNVLTLELVLRGGLILLLCLLAEPLLRWLIPAYRPEYLGYLYTVLAAALAGSLWPTVSFLMTVRHDSQRFALVSLLQVLVNSAATVMCLSLFGWGVESLFIAMLATACVSVVVELLYIYPLVNFSLQGKWLREIYRTGLKATPGGLAEAASNMVDRMAIQHWSGLGSLGLYSHSQQYQSIFKMFTAALSNTLMSDSLRIYSRNLDHAPVERLLSAWYGMLAIVGIVVALFSDDVIALLSHGKFTGAAPLVNIWYLIVFSVSHSIPYANFLVARKHNRVLMYTQLVPTLAGIPLVIFGAYAYGVFGAAWAMLLANVTTQATRCYLAHQFGFQGVAERQFIEALLLYGCLWIADHFLAWSIKFELAVFLILLLGVVLRFNLKQELVSVLRKWAGR